MSQIDIASCRPNQLFMPHIKMLDFVAWPAFREFVVSVPAMSEKMEWIIDMSISIRSDWHSSDNDTFQRDEQTGFLDLCPAAKVLEALAGFFMVADWGRILSETFRVGLWDRLFELL
jgi:hypothetical protein